VIAFSGEMHPHRPSHTFIVGLIVLDLPVLLAIAVVGAWLGYHHTYDAVTDWRLDHPWSLIPSAALAVWLLIRWKRAR